MCRFFRADIYQHLKHAEISRCTYLIPGGGSHEDIGFGRSLNWFVDWVGIITVFTIVPTSQKRIFLNQGWNCAHAKLHKNSQLYSRVKIMQKFIDFCTQIDDKYKFSSCLVLTCGNFMIVCSMIVSVYPPKGKVPKAKMLPMGQLQGGAKMVMGANFDWGPTSPGLGGNPMEMPLTQTPHRQPTNQNDMPFKQPQMGKNIAW